MAVELFEGFAQHRGLLGEKGGYVVATNNGNYARAFGKSTSGAIGTIKNGKITMYRIGGTSYSSGEQQGIVAIDPRELNRIDALDYVSSHVGEVYDWKELALAIGQQYSTQFDLITYTLTPDKKFRDLNNEQQGIVIQLYFNQVSLEEARESFDEVKANYDDRQEFVDRLRRRIQSIKATETSRVGGVEFSINGYVGGGIRIEDENKVLIKFNISPHVVGSKSRGRKVEKEQFTKIKDEISKQCKDYSEDKVFTFTLDDIEDSVTDTYVQVYTELRNTVRMISNDITTNKDFEEYPDFNRISAISKLYTSLGLGSDIGYKDLDEDLLRAYWNNEISSFEFANASENQMPQRVVHAVVNRRLADKNLDLEGFTERLTSILTQDYVLSENQSENYDLISYDVRNLIWDRFNEIKDEISGVTSYSEAFYYYSSPIKQYTDQIEQYVLNKFNVDNSDKLAEDTKIMLSLAQDALKKTLQEDLDYAYERFVTASHLDNVEGALQPTLPDLVSSKYKDSLVVEFRQQIADTVTDKAIIHELIKQFMNEKGNAYFDGLIQNEYDYEKGMQAARDLIMENITTLPDYRFVSRDYLRNILLKVNSLPLLCELASIDQVDNFIEKYAPDWEENIDENSVKAEQKHDMVEQLKANSELQNAFESSVTMLCDSQLQEFAKLFNLRYADKFLPLSFVNNAKDVILSNDVFKTDLINKVVADNDDILEIPEYTKLIINEVQHVNSVNGLSFSAFYLKLYLDEPNYKELALVTLKLLATIVPPYRNKSEEYWEKTFKNAINRDNNVMKFISFADNADITSAVELAGDTDEETETKTTVENVKPYISIKIFSKYIKILEDKLKDNNINLRGLLVNDNTLPTLRQEIRAIILDHFNKEKENISKYPSISLKNDRITITKEYVEQNLEPEILEKVDALVERITTNAPLKSKRIFVEELAALKNINRDIATVIIGKALSSVEPKEDKYPYAEKPDVFGFLEKYYPEWEEVLKENSDTESEAESDVTNDEVDALYRKFDQISLDYYSDLVTDTIDNTYPNISAQLSAYLRYTPYCEMIVQVAHSMLMDNLNSKLENKSLQEKKVVLTDGSVDFKDAVDYVKDSLSKENLNENVLLEYKKTMFEQLRTFLNANNIDPEKQDALRQKVLGEQDIKWLNSFADNPPTLDFLKDYMPELFETDTLTYDDAHKILLSMRNDISSRVEQALTDKLKEENYLNVPAEIVQIPGKRLDTTVDVVVDYINTLFVNSYQMQRNFTPNEDEIKDIILSNLKDDNFNSSIDACYNLLDNEINQEAKTKAIQYLSTTKPYNSRDKGFWSNEIMYLRGGDFASLVFTDDFNKLVEKYIPDWKEKAEKENNTPEFKEEYIRLLRLGISKATRTKFAGNKFLIKTQYKSVDGLAEYIVDSYKDNFFDDYKLYVAKSKSDQAGRNYFSSTSFKNLYEDITTKLVSEDDLRKAVIDDLNKDMGSILAKEDLNKIYRSSFSTEYILNASTDNNLRNELFSSLGITINIDITKKLSTDEVQDIICTETEPMILEFAREEPFENYLMDKRLDNDGYFGRVSDADQAGKRQLNNIQIKMSSYVLKNWYMEYKYTLLFMPENKTVLISNIKNYFNSVKIKSFEQKIFKSLIEIYIGRTDEMYDKAINDYFKPWLKATPPYNQIPADYLVSQLKQVRNTIRGAETLISAASRNEAFDVFIDKYLGSWRDVLNDNAGEETDITKESVSDVLRSLFSDAVRSYYSNYNLPADIVEKIAVSNDIDKLIAIEVSNSYKDIKDTSPSIEDTPELKRYIVETQGYSNNELESIINQNVNIENFRNIVVPDVEEKILNEALVDDVTLNNFLDKLSVEDMIEIYKTSDVNSFLQRFQRA